METRRAACLSPIAPRASRQRCVRRRRAASLLICGLLALSAYGGAATTYAATGGELPPSCGPQGACVDPPPADNNDPTVDNGTVGVDDPGPPVDPTVDTTSAPDVVISADGTKAVAAAQAGPTRSKSATPKRAFTPVIAVTGSGTSPQQGELPYTGFPLTALAAIGSLMLLAGCLLQVLPTTRALRASHPPAT